jgi:hypothetical protein
MLSPTVDNDDWDFRIALNAYCLGQHPDAFRREQVNALHRPGFLGPWGRDPAKMERRIASRLDWFERILSQPERYLERGGVSYAILPSGLVPAGGRQRWLEVQAGPQWAIWYRPGANRDEPGPHSR